MKSKTCLFLIALLALGNCAEYVATKFFQNANCTGLTFTTVDSGCDSTLGSGLSNSRGCENGIPYLYSYFNEDCSGAPDSKLDLSASGCEVIPPSVFTLTSCISDTEFSTGTPISQAHSIRPTCNRFSTIFINAPCSFVGSFYQSDFCTSGMYVHQIFSQSNCSPGSLISKVFLNETQCSGTGETFTQQNFCLTSDFSLIMEPNPGSSSLLQPAFWTFLSAILMYYKNIL
jgi:hypothetical protein